MIVDRPLQFTRTITAKESQIGSLINLVLACNLQWETGFSPGSLLKGLSRAPQVEEHLPSRDSLPTMVNQRHAHRSRVSIHQINNYHVTDQKTVREKSAHRRQIKTHCGLEEDCKESTYFCSATGFFCILSFLHFLRAFSFTLKEGNIARIIRQHSGTSRPKWSCLCSVFSSAVSRSRVQRTDQELHT